jgi:hypothetical protein
MRGLWITATLTAVLMLAVLACGQEGEANQEGAKETAISFKNDVVPILTRHCMPCHAEENYNPSELSLDSYDDLMAGGKHGVPVVPGKAEESIIIKKLGADPPFGDRMPLVKKKHPGPPNKLTPEELDTLSVWINQGAKNN